MKCNETEQKTTKQNGTKSKKYRDSATVKDYGILAQKKDFNHTIIYGFSKKVVQIL